VRRRIHDQIIDRNLDQRIGRIALRELRLDEDHGRTGGRAEQDEPADIFLSVLWRDRVREQEFEKQDSQRRQGERLYQPIDGQRDDQPLWTLADMAEGRKVHIHHHGVDHGSDEGRPHEVNRRIFQICESLE